MITKHNLETYYDGGSLDAIELLSLHAHMVKTAEMLSPLGDRFHFAMVECNRVAHVTKGYLDSRNIKIEVIT